MRELGVNPELPIRCGRRMGFMTVSMRMHENTLRT